MIRFNLLSGMVSVPDREGIASKPDPIRTVIGPQRVSSKRSTAVAEVVRPALQRRVSR
jgi:hypothetical protein